MSENVENNNPSTDLSSLIGGLLSNPDAISKMSNIISNLTANQNSTNSPPNNENKEIIEKSNDDIENNTSNDEDYSPTFQNFDTTNILSKMPGILSKISSAKFKSAPVFDSSPPGLNSRKQSILCSKSAVARSILSNNATESTE